MTGMSPWNYGNYYMGNTTMQMMPMMMRKVERYAQRQAMSGYGGGGGFGGMPMMPMMPMMPCLPAAPMMAAASPLPMACNPLVQNMYPMASMNPTGFMSPASFMSGLNTGPMPFRPPASIEFPSNVGMVMNLPYGSPNPMFPMPSFGGFSPQFGAGGGLSCCCCYCTPAISAPTVTYYPRPVCVPQACPVPVPVPVPIPNIQQVPGTARCHRRCSSDLRRRQPRLSNVRWISTDALSRYVHTRWNGSDHRHGLESAINDQLSSG